MRKTFTAKDAKEREGKPEYWDAIRVAICGEV
jgi:hypothetical protein